MTGYKDETGKIHHEIGVYYVSKKHLGAGHINYAFSAVPILTKQFKLQYS